MNDKELKPLANIHAWQRSSGAYVEMCVVDELNTDSTESVPAYITFGGFSLCPDHFKKVTDLIKDGTPMGAIVNQMMTTGLDS